MANETYFPQTNKITLDILLLMWASYNGLKDIVQMLLQVENINVNQQNDNGINVIKILFKCYC